MCAARRRQYGAIGALRPGDAIVPYKGDANYFSVNAGGKTLENAIWTYETPFPAMGDITGYLAFYPDKVTIEEVG